MGLDLHFLPVECLDIKQGRDGKTHTWGYSHSLLNWGGGSGVYDQIEALKPDKLPEGHSISAYCARRPDDEYGYGVLKATPYGQPYTWVTAGDLLPILKSERPKHPVTLYIGRLNRNARSSCTGTRRISWA